MAMASNPSTATAVAAPPEELTPTTPRPSHGFSDLALKSHAEAEDVSVITPTRESFSAPLASTPLQVASSGGDDMERVDSTLSNMEDGHEASSPARTAEASSPDGQENDDKLDGDTTRPSKKKKGQRFFCTGFPPCNLSFTRSEHLARHIRKHTGERPFGCHCGRRFSRLDNLRQHAQTVHVNEEIPSSSLAATGTRYQRQVRTERVRPTGRSRAATFSAGNTAAGVRSHNRTQSTSSLASVSTTSSFAAVDDFRRSGYGEPQRNRLSLDTFVSASSSTQPSFFNNNAASPSGYSTPASSTYSLGTSSPRFSSGLQTPASTASRTLGFSNRRLSIPGSNPFQARAESQQQSLATSPAPSSAAISRNSVYNPAMQILEARREAANDEVRRRTWHPNTTTGLGSRVPNLGGPTIPELPRPVFPSQQQQQQQVRLPPISSFEFDKDNAPPPPLIRRQPSPMQLDPPPTSHPTEESQDTSQNRISWTSSLQQGINRLGISSRPQSTDYSHTVINTTIPEASAGITTNPSPSSGHSRQTSSASHATGVEASPSDRRARRMGWYMQPPPPPSTSALRTSPDSSSSDGINTPVTTAADHHPTIVQNNNGAGQGYESQQDVAMEGVDEPNQKIHQVLLPPPASVMANPHSLASGTPPSGPVRYHDPLQRITPHPQLAQISEYRPSDQSPAQAQRHSYSSLPYRPLGIFTEYPPPPAHPPPQSALPPLPPAQDRLEDRAGLEVLAAAARLSENQRA